MSGKRTRPISERQAAHLERLSEAKKKHGLCEHPLYQVWLSMKQRCLNESEPSYQNYGGRGITICAEWLADFNAFYRWAIGAAWAPNLFIDRENNNGNYEPDNCRWVPRQVNNQNRRNTLSTEKVLSVYLASGSHADAGRECGVPYTVAAKIRRGQTYANITQGEAP